jgi:hypothetical protein
MQLTALENDLKLTQEPAPHAKNLSCGLNHQKRLGLKPVFGLLAVLWMWMISQCVDGNLGTGGESLEEKEVSYRQILASRSPIKAIKGGCEVDR